MDLTSTYPDFFKAFTNITPMTLVLLFMLIMCRLAPIIRLAPFFAARMTPRTARAGLAIALSSIFLPMLLGRVSAPIAFDMNFVVLALKEIMVGYIIGYLVSIPFFMLSSAGVLIDFLRGASVMQQQDPAMQTQASPIGILYNYVLIVVFFQIDGPYYLFDALLNSYTLVPPDGLLSQQFFNLNLPFWQTAISLMHKIIEVAIQLAAPSLIAVLMGEMFLGIANRLAPNVQFAFLGIAIKSFLGIGLMWLAWYFVVEKMDNKLVDWFKMINYLIDSSKSVLGIT